MLIKMKKNHNFVKFILLFICSLIVVLIIGFAALKRDYTPSEFFIDGCSAVFNGTTGYSMLDGSGKDITERFVSEYYDLYESKDYAGLADIMAENRYVLTSGTTVIDGQID